MILGANYMKKHWLSAYQDKFAYLPAFKWKQPAANISSKIFFSKICWQILQKYILCISSELLR